MAAAKPLLWRGRGELPQLPWQRPCTGLVLVIDLWSGLGGLLVSVLALGIRCIALSAEMDTTLHMALASAFPNLVMISRVEDITASQFSAVIKRRSFSSILIGGGSPCQGNTSLNSRRQGMGDSRSNQPKLLHQLVQDLRASAS